jgi:uncharacterized repeat protein (TIGR01451 family)
MYNISNKKYIFNRKMKNLLLNKLIALSIIALSSLVSANAIEAKEICYTQYGGGETCFDVDENSKLDVTKEVYNPKTKDYEENIDYRNYLFDPEETIKFRIVVKNKGETTIENIKVKDVLPSYVTYESGDGDDSNDGSRVEFDEFDLEPGESEEFEFKAEVSDDGILPKDDRLCLTNIATAKGEVEDSNDTESDTDYANFCIKLPEVKGKETISKLPTTGIVAEENMKYLFIGSLSLGLMLIGFGLKKLAR